jgi:hypothetical protein
MKDITLKDMEQEIDLDDILLKDGPDAHERFALFVIQVYFRKLCKVIEEHGSITKELRKRSLLYAKHQAMSWLIREGKPLIDRSMSFMVEEAKRTGWYKSDHFSYSDVEDLIASLVDETEDGSADRWAWTTFANKIIPAARSAGIEPGLLAASATGIKKVRHCLAPAWNELSDRMKTGAISVDEGKSTMDWLLQLSADPKITYTVMQKEVNNWRGKTVKAPEAIPGFEVLLGNQETWFLIKTQSGVNTKRVEQALRKISDLEIVGLKTMLRILNEEFFEKEE